MDKIEAQQFGDVFSDIRLQHVYCNDRYSETITHLAEPRLAEASIRIIQTPELELTQANFKTERELAIDNAESTESISSSFILSGGLESRFEAGKSPVHHWINTHGFQYIPDFSGTHIIRANQLHAISLSYNNNFFKSIGQSAGIPYIDKVLNCMERGQTLLAAPGTMMLQPRMAELLHAILHCSFQGITKYIFIEAKMLELFVLQMEQLNAGSRVKDEWSLADKERLKAVHDFIVQNFLQPLTLKNICYKFGVNEFKLKKGYKYLFGSTVFAHILKLRLQYAQQLLTSGQMNVSEVSFHIGYNNISSFSEAFKKQFGYLPGTISKAHLFVAV